MALQPCRLYLGYLNAAASALTSPTFLFICNNRGLLDPTKHVITRAGPEMHINIKQQPHHLDHDPNPAFCKARTGSAASNAVGQRDG